MPVALVTGSNGFVGQHVCESLQEEGFEVVRVLRGDARSTGKSVSMPDNAASTKHSAEVIDEVAPSVIYHLAGTSQATDVCRLYDSNVVYAENLLRAALLSKCRPKVLLVGSAAEYGAPLSQDGVVRESDICKPVSAYGISKLAQTYHGLLAAEGGLHVTIARLFNPIGVGSPTTSSLGDFVSQIAAMGRKGILETGRLNAIRDFISVSEAARAIIRIPFAQSNLGGIFNVCTGIGLQMTDVVSRLIEISSTDVTHKVDASRGGTSNVDVVIGCNSRLRDIGIEVASTDIDNLLREMLHAEQMRLSGSNA